MPLSPLATVLVSFAAVALVDARVDARVAPLPPEARVAPVAPVRAVRAVRAVRESNVAEPDYASFFSGSNIDAVTTPAGGVLLAGGGTDSDDGMRWLLAQGGKRAADAYGDVVVLRASGSDGYNDYLMALGANSVTSIVIGSVEGANSEFVRTTIARAEVVFLAGGDQSRYERLWRGTVLQRAVHARIAQGYPIGGTSAGLAVLGEYVYSALNVSATSKSVLQNPFDTSATFARALFTVPHLTNVITDSHFVARDRMGRLLGFLARLEPLFGARAPRAVAVDEKSAIGMNASGSAIVFGSGKGAYFLSTTSVRTRTVASATPLTYTPVTVVHVPVGKRFDFAAWTTGDAEPYTLSANAGVVSSSKGTVY